MRTGSWLLAAVALLFGVARASGIFEATLWARVKAPKGSEFNQPKTRCTITLRSDSAQFALGQYTLILQSRPTKVVQRHISKFFCFKKNTNNARLTLHYTKEGYEITLFGTSLALEGVSTFLSTPDQPQTPAPTTTTAGQEEEPAPVADPASINSDPDLGLQTPALTIVPDRREEPAPVAGLGPINFDPNLGLGCWDGHIAGAVIGTVGTLFLLLYMYLVEHVFCCGYSIS